MFFCGLTINFIFNLMYLIYFIFNLLFYCIYKGNIYGFYKVKQTISITVTKGVIYMEVFSFGIEIIVICKA